VGVSAGVSGKVLDLGPSFIRTHVTEAFAAIHEVIGTSAVTILIGSDAASGRSANSVTN
jgi:hypothetical protein